MSGKMQVCATRAVSTAWVYEEGVCKLLEWVVFCICFGIGFMDSELESLLRCSEHLGVFSHSFMSSFSHLVV